MKSGVTRITFSEHRLTHQDVMDIRQNVRNLPDGRVVVVDLRDTQETTTAALAALILLRRERIVSGGDLLLLGLTGKAHYLYEILRLAKVLPRRPCISPRRYRQIRDGRDSSSCGKRPIRTGESQRDRVEAMA